MKSFEEGERRKEIPRKNGDTRRGGMDTSQETPMVAKDLFWATMVL